MRHAVVLAGMGFGDEGKGSVTDAVVRQTRSTLVVRYNGGCQAAHTVVLDGRWHMFHQFGAGTFAGARTHLSRYMLIEPFTLRREADALRGMGVSRPWGLLSVDKRCVVVTPYHQAANRLRELARGDKRHGSCGMGVGEAVSDLIHCPAISIRADSLSNERRTHGLLECVRAVKLAEASEWEDLLWDHPMFALLRDATASGVYARQYAEIAKQMTLFPDEGVLNATEGVVVFEGAQGVLLDETHGFAPHTTWSTTTFANALTLIAEADRAASITKVGVLRSYMTRHGAGPLPTEHAAWTNVLVEPHNQHGEWQGPMRVGAFDSELVSYAIMVSGGVDRLALTHLDLVTPDWPVCTAYRDHSAPMPIDRAVRCAQPIYAKIGPASAFVSWVTERFGVQVGIESYGPQAGDKQIKDIGCAILNSERV